MQLPTTDQLTGLLSYSAWKQALDEALADGKARGVILLDLDRFALLNQVYGHLRGDEVLVAVAAALKQTALVVGRPTADLFTALVLEGDTEAIAQEAWRVANGVLKAFETQAIRDASAELSRLNAAIAKREGWPEVPLRTDADRVLGFSAVAVDLGDCHETTAGLIQRLNEALAEVKRSSRGRLVMLPPYGPAASKGDENIS